MIQYAFPGREINIAGPKTRPQEAIISPVAHGRPYHRDSVLEVLFFIHY